MASEPGIPGYRGLELIGRGGFATVYRAHQVAFGDRVVAIKVLSGDLDDAAQHRFERECHAAGRLSWHPNVVSVYDAGMADDGRPYLVMEYLRQGSLADLISGRPLAWPEAVARTIPVAGALAAAHETNMTHRDVKPANILVGHLDEPKLTDFGIARVEGSTASRTGGIHATLAHAAPEALEGEGGPSSDVYSLASSLYELVAGSPAFVRSTDESITPVIARIATAPPPNLRALGVPDEIAAVVAAGMAKAPADRPESAEAFGRLLQDAQGRLGLPPVRMLVSLDPPATPGLPDRSVAVTGMPADDPAPAPEEANPPPPTPDQPPPATGKASETIEIMPPPGTSPPADDRPRDGTVLVAAAASPPPAAGDPAPSAGQPPVGQPPAAGPASAPPPRPPKPTGKRRLPLFVAGGVALLVVLALVVGGLTLLGGDDGGEGDSGSSGSSSSGQATAEEPAAIGAVEAFPAGAGPLGISAGASDALIYVADQDDDSIVVLDGEGEQLASLAAEGRPRRVAPRSAGGVWVSFTDTGEVAAVEESGLSQRVSVGPEPIGVEEGLGSVWVASSADGSVTRLDPSTMEVQQTYEAVGQDLRGITTGEGAVWVADHASSTVVRLDPDTGDTSTFDVGEAPGALVFTDQGLWATSFEAGTVARIDMDELAVVDTVEVGPDPNAIASGAGAIWVTVQGADEVVRLDPESAAIIDRTPVGSRPAGVTVTEDAAWVTNLGDGTASRITLE